MLNKNSILYTLIKYNFVFYMVTLIVSVLFYKYSIQKTIEYDNQKNFKAAEFVLKSFLEEKIENNFITIKLLSFFGNIDSDKELEGDLDRLLKTHIISQIGDNVIYIFKDEKLYYKINKSSLKIDYDKFIAKQEKVLIFTSFIFIENHLHTISQKKVNNFTFIVIDTISELEIFNNDKFIIAWNTNNPLYEYTKLSLPMYFNFDCYIGMKKQDFFNKHYILLPSIFLLLNLCISIFYLLYNYYRIIIPLLKIQKFIKNITPETSYVLFPNRDDEIGNLSYKLHNLLLTIYENTEKEKIYLTELSEKTDKIEKLNKLMVVIEKNTKILTYLVENIDIGLCVIEGKTIIYCNEVFSTLLKVNCSNQNLDSILKILNPYLKYLLELNKDGDLICCVDNKNINVSFKILSNNIIILTQNITEISKLQKDLKDINTFYTALFNYSPTPTIIIDADKVIKNVNVAFLDVFKLYTVDNLVYNLSVYIPDFDLSSKVTSTTTCKTLDNVEFKSEIICIKIKNTDLFILFLSKINSDNEKLYNLNIQLEEKSRKLEELYNELEKYTHIIAHDLKAPLRGIFNSLDIVRTNLDLYIKTNNFDNFNKFITLAYQSSVRLNILITRLSELNKYMKCQIDTIIEPSLIINSVIQDLNFDISAKKATITVQSNIPRIKSSELLFRQVIQNLIVNSMKFCKELPIINITFNTTANSIIINISDNGIGIKSNQDIFIIFKRLNSNIEGDGVGLSIVKKIMEKHNGKIWYEDNKPSGVIFHLEFNKIGE